MIIVYLIYSLLLVVYVVYFEVYGCQMNVSDTEIAWSILKNVGYTKTSDVNEVNIPPLMSVCHML